MRLVSCLLLLVVGSLPSLATENLGWHIVRPGDTLEEVTAHYLGSHERWRENHALNPHVENPHLLRPGDRIRVLLDDSLPENSAWVTQVSGGADEQPTPITWGEAKTEDLLREGDGVRTEERESMKLVFPDDSSLTITEDSLIFLAKLGRQHEQARRDTVEIEHGQADFASLGARAPSGEVEIILGAATALTRSEGGASQARARRPEAGGAELMIYTGKAELAAAGKTVEVPEGMGSTVPEEGPPSPPEQLLPAPQMELPADGSELFTPNPAFAWAPVPGAASYQVEVCRDPDCGHLVQRETGLAAPTWRPERLGQGSYFWRATAISVSGLDGYPSSPSSFAILSDQPDLIPPKGEVKILGGALWVGDTLFVGPNLKLEAAVDDAESGVARWSAVRDGQPSEDAWEGLAAAGERTISLEVFDRAGNRYVTDPFRIVGDSEPPTLRWEIGGTELVDSGGRHPVPPSRTRKQIKRNGSGLEWSNVGSDWTPMSRVTRSRKKGEMQSPRRWTIRSRAPDLFLIAHRPGTFAADSEIQLESSQLARLIVEDAASGVAQMVFGLEDGSLTLVATDLVGNQSRWSFPLSVP